MINFLSKSKAKLIPNEEILKQIGEKLITKYHWGFCVLKVEVVEQQGEVVANIVLMMRRSGITIGGIVLRVDFTTFSQIFLTLG